MWEPLIVVGGRQEPPGKCDWLRAQPARFGGDLPGRKPLAFVAFLWRMLGAKPGDTLDDKFPGTGIVGRAWENLSRAALNDMSAVGFDDASPEAFNDTSHGYRDDDASPAPDDTTHEYFDDV